MGALDDLTKKAREFVEQNREQIDAALQSEKAEEVSDQVLDAVAGKIDDVTGGQHADRIADAREQADGKIGNQ